MTQGRTQFYYRRKDFSFHHFQVLFDRKTGWIFSRLDVLPVAFNAVFTLSRLIVFTGNQSNSMLPHCPAGLIFCQYTVLVRSTIGYRSNS